jgi:hypothetical protein
MSFSRGQRLARTPIQIAIWAALLVLSLGLPRFLVVCSGPHCDVRIELAHPSGNCDHSHGGASDEDQGDAYCKDLGQCVDAALGLATGPLPERVVLGQPNLVCAGMVTPFSLDCPVHYAVSRPPTTGPPRTDQRTELLASTLLLL